MDNRLQNGASSSFSAPLNWLNTLQPDVAGQVLMGASDIALVLDEDGVIHDLALANDDLAKEGLANWRGQAWIDTVTIESKSKVIDLLQSVGGKTGQRFREVNHPSLTGPDIPMRYSSIRLANEGKIIAFGRDLRNLSRLQQRFMEAQQAMEREYSRLRAAETRYRMLFQLGSQPVIVVDAASLRVEEANPAAVSALAPGGERLLTLPFISAFGPQNAEELELALKSARITGQSRDVDVLAARTGRPFRVSASLFRHERSAHLLVRLEALDDPAALHAAGQDASRMMNVIEHLPDGFVLVDERLNIQEVNRAFLDLAQLATKPQVICQPLETWLGRPGLDMELLMSSLTEHGAVRNFSTILRGSFGGVEDVEVSAVPALVGESASFGFVIRSTSVRVAIDDQRSRALPRSVEHLTELIGRVTLKEMVRETTDVIERLCIEASLELSKDNRASAAQMLGLSRQSLYAKMRRHGLGDLDGEEGVEEE
jgi:transcriptional regulator PpsR